MYALHAEYCVVQPPSVTVEVHTLIGHAVVTLETIDISKGAEIDAFIPEGYTTTMGAWIPDTYVVRTFGIIVHQDHH